MSMIVCRYGEGAIEQSANLSSTDQTALAGLLNSASNGLSGIDPSFTTQCPVYSDRDSYRLITSYPDHHQSVLTARIGTCGLVGVTDGSQNKQMSSNLAILLTKLAGSTITWPDAFVLDK